MALTFADQQKLVSLLNRLSKATYSLQSGLDPEKQGVDFNGRAIAKSKGVGQVHKFVLLNTFEALTELKSYMLIQMDNTREATAFMLCEKEGGNKA